MSKDQLYGGTDKQFQKQLEHAERVIAELEQKLRSEGYINTIHDVWEKKETE